MSVAKATSSEDSWEVDDDTSAAVLLTAPFCVVFIGADDLSSTMTILLRTIIPKTKDVRHNRTEYAHDDDNRLLCLLEYFESYGEEELLPPFLLLGGDLTVEEEADGRNILARKKPTPEIILSYRGVSLCQRPMRCVVLCFDFGHLDIMS